MVADSSTIAALQITLSISDWDEALPAAVIADDGVLWQGLFVVFTDEGQDLLAKISLDPR